MLRCGSAIVSLEVPRLSLGFRGLGFRVKEFGVFRKYWALEYHALILFWDLFLKGNHYEKKSILFSLVTSKSSIGLDSERGNFKLFGLIY